MGKNNWNLQDMQDTLVKDTEQRIEHGFEKIKNGQTVEPVAVPQQPKDAEPTKGVQTYIPMSLYRRLNDIKLTRGDTIASLVAEAVALWVDVQEGKRLLMGNEVSETI
jgi:hypothetical protein